MAKFYDGEWFGTHYKIIPIDKCYIWIPSLFSKTKKPYRITLPYYDRNRIKFKVKVLRFGTKYLQDFNIVQDYSIPDGSRRKTTVPTNKNLPVTKEDFDNINEIEFISEGEIFYSLGEIYSDDWIPLVEARLFKTENIFHNSIGLFISGLIGLIFGILLMIIKNYFSTP